MALATWVEFLGDKLKDTIPGDEPSVTLAQLHNELGSRASTTTDDAFHNLQRSDYIHKMGWIKRNS